MPHCNIVEIPSNAKKRGVDKTIEFAAIAGVRFIELNHRRGFHEHAMRVRGFQGGVIRNNGGKNGQNSYFFDKDTLLDGTDTFNGNALEFKPEELTNQLKSWVPDTEYNRNFMSVHVFKQNKNFHIVDPDIRKEIEDLAVEKGHNVVKVDKTSALIKDQNSEIEKLRVQLDEYKKREESRETFETTTKVLEEREDTIETQAREEVHAEEKEWIDLELDKYLKGNKSRTKEMFFKGKKYSDYIVPKINSRVLSKGK